MRHEDVVSGSLWDDVVGLFPVDLEATARACGAMERVRVIRSASDLLRVVLCRVLYGYSTREMATWMAEVGLADVSWVAVWKRLRKCAGWLKFLVGAMLLGVERDAGLPAVSIRLLDATMVTGPGRNGKQWRVHTGFDLGQWRMTTVEVTDNRGGETLDRHTLGPGEIGVADRGYAHREAVAGVLDAGGRIVVRIHCKNFPLETPEGEDFNLLKCAKGMKCGEVREWDLRFRLRGRRDPKTRRWQGGQLYPVRFVVVAKDKKSVEKERAKIRKAARKKGHEPDPWSLKAAAYTYVLTNVETEVLDGHQILALYRLRWQVEMFFKRLKSILRLDALPSKDPESAKAYLYTALLACILVETLAQRAGAFPPAQGPGPDATDQCVPSLA